MKNLKLKDIIKIADKGYEDGLVEAYHKDRDGEHGDTLAKYVAIELAETFDKKATKEAQLEEAIKVMSTGERELRQVIDALETELMKVQHPRRPDARFALYTPKSPEGAARIKRVIARINRVLAELKKKMLSPKQAGERLWKIMEPNRDIGAYDTSSREEVWLKAKELCGTKIADKVFEQFT